MSGLNQEEFEDVLKIFCSLSFFEGKVDWDFDYVNEKFKLIKTKKNIDFSIEKVIKDLKSAIALWVEDNGIYAFAHKSLQEYFAALFVKHVNSQDKEKIYNKIIDKLSGRKALNEYENFLSLLYEMDPLNFQQFYAIPLFKELRIQIDNSNEQSLIYSSIGLVVEKVGPKLKEPMIKTSDEILNGVYINYNTANRAIYFHIPYTRLIVDGLRSSFYDYCDFYKITSFQELDEDLIRFSYQKHESGNFFLPYIETVNENYYNFFETRILSISKKLDKYIDDQIKLHQNDICNSILADSNIIDLI